MRRFGTIAVVLALTASAAGCGGGSGDGADDDVDGATPTTAAVTTMPVPSTAGGTTVAPTNLTLRVTDVQLVNSEDSDNGVRILLPAGVATASVTLTGIGAPSRISVCQARELESRLSTAACRTPAGGEAVTVTLGSAASGVEIVPVVAPGGSPATSTTTLEEVTIRYAASSREVNVRLPQIAAGESGGRPTFGLSPAGPGGAYQARLTWTVIQVFGGTPSNAQLELLQGGAVANTAASGGLEVRLTGTVPAPTGDTAVRVQNIGSSAMVSPKLNLLLP